MRYVNRASNSCKIGLKRQYDFLEILLHALKLKYKRVCLFWTSYTYTMFSLDENFVSEIFKIVLV